MLLTKRQIINPDENKTLVVGGDKIGSELSISKIILNFE